MFISKTSRRFIKAIVCFENGYGQIIRAQLMRCRVLGVKGDNYVLRHPHGGEFLWPVK
jgi:hypothetical protein